VIPKEIIEMEKLKAKEQILNTACSSIKSCTGRFLLYVFLGDEKFMTTLIYQPLESKQ
jgi:hypothetical protein